MQSGPPDLARVRLDNALALFEEFVRATARHADAATLRGLERRFAERLQIQPSYWSQIKSRSRQIGERLARQFEHLCHKPRGWMDVPHAAHGADDKSVAKGQASTRRADPADAPTHGERDSAPRDDEERFIVGLVLTYYRRHPQRARTRLLDLLGEVLLPPVVTAPTRDGGAAPDAGASKSPLHRPVRPEAQAPGDDEAQALWARTQTGVAPLKQRK